MNRGAAVSYSSLCEGALPWRSQVSGAPHPPTLPTARLAPALQRKLKGDDALIEIPIQKSADSAAIVVGYFTFHAKDALRLCGMGFALSTIQNGVNGARQVWLKDMEAAAMRKEYGDMQTRLAAAMVRCSLAGVRVGR